MQSLLSSPQQLTDESETLTDQPDKQIFQTWRKKLQHRNHPRHPDILNIQTLKKTDNAEIHDIPYIPDFLVFSYALILPVISDIQPNSYIPYDLDILNIQNILSSPATYSIHSKHLTFKAFKTFQRC